MIFLKKMKIIIYFYFEFCHIIAPLLCIAHEIRTNVRDYQV